MSQTPQLDVTGRIETGAGRVQARVRRAETASPLQYLLRLQHQTRGVGGVLARPLRAVLAQGPGHQETAPSAKSSYSPGTYGESTCERSFEISLSISQRLR